MPAVPEISEISDASDLRAHLAAALDDLALQIMVKGAAAFRAKPLSQLIESAEACSAADIAAEARLSVQQAKSKSLTEEQAKASVARMQALLFAAAGSQANAASQASAPAPLAFEEDPELLGDFVLEADEHLAAIEEKILLLEKDPSLIDTIHSVFRSFHSIKGLAGFLGLTGVQAVAHEVETLLDHARNLRIAVDSDVVDLVLESSGYLQEEVSVVKARLAGSPLPPVRDNTALIQTLSTATANVAAGRAISPRTGAEAIPTAASPPDAPLPGTALVSEPELEGRSEAAAESQFQARLDSEPEAKAESEPETKSESEPEAETAPPAPAMAEPVTSVVTLTGPAAVSSAAAPKPLPKPVPDAAPVAEPRSAPAPGAPNSRAEAGSTSIRVETQKLDRLMDMVGEMVIAQSILSNTSRSESSDPRLASEMSRLARITSEVQRCAMSMRMMPIGPLFQKNAKMVRDLARRNGKQVSLELLGEATELDKTIAEELSDPLLHMIRNALDHGIEPPEERIAAGKPPLALLRIAAEHQAGQIVISISDDGRGLDPHKLRNKAIEKGLIDETTHLTDDETFHLIFAPGFSTAETITDISGRGVGMDVVRQHVEGLRGRIEITSELGKGTTFFLHLPLTLAIIEGLVTVVGGHRYIIPLFSVREMFRPTQDMLFTVQGSDEMILMRGSLLPLVRLHKRFSLTPRSECICDGLLVVCEFSGKLYCLFVDDLLGRQEVVIKSLDEAFKTVRGLVGSAILGDGGIGLILDVAGIFNSPPLLQEPLCA